MSGYLGGCRRMQSRNVAIATNFALIEVDVPNDTNDATIKYVIDVEGCFEEVPTTPLGLNQKKVDELVEESRKLSERFSKALKSERSYERWQADYRSLGERFHKLLDTRRFENHLRTIGGVVKGRSDLDIRLRFSLGRLCVRWLVGIDLQSCGQPFDAGSNHRASREGCGRHFREAPTGAIGTLNILVIGATLDDNSAPEGPGDFLWKKHWGNSRLNSLPHIEDEVAAIKALEQLPHNVKVHVLDGEDRHDADDGWSLADKVRTHLAENPEPL